MKRAQIFYAVCGLLVAATVIGLYQKSLSWHGQASNNDATVESNVENCLRLLRDSDVIAFNRWRVEGSPDKGLIYTVRAFDQDPCYEGKGVKLSMFNEPGALIYEKCFSEVHRVYLSNALREASFPQLVLEVSYGGSDGFLEMLDYQDGKVVSLTDAIKPNNSFRSGANVRPQFRSSIIPALEPSEILLTPDGLANPGEKYTVVYRYKDGAYRYAGEFSQRKVDDYIEELMKQPKR